MFSLAGLRKIREEGVTFASHVDGRRLFIGPEESMRIQSNLGSTIAMAFDECVENPAAYDYARESCARTTRWLIRCKEEHDRLNALPAALNPRQLLFGINQGCTFDDLRVAHMKDIAALGLDGYAIGGLAVGEPAPVMYRVIEAVEPYMPADKPRYLMGGWAHRSISSKAWRAASTCSIASCRPAMPGTGMCSPGAGGATCSISSMNGISHPSTRHAAARPAAGTRGRISAICSKRGRCSQCGCA